MLSMQVFRDENHLSYQVSSMTSSGFDGFNA